MAFIGKVVSISMQQTKKTSILKTIVDAADEYSGIKDLTVEILHEMLLPIPNGFLQCSD